MEDMEEPADQPPEPIDVARRALILSGVVCRASIERYSDEDYKHETAGQIHEWFTELDLWPYLEPQEEEIIRAAFGEMPRRLQVEGTWFIEGLAVLAWALGRDVFPPHDTKVDPIAVTNALDFLDDGARHLLMSPQLRDRVELDAAREWYYDVHCTLRGFTNHGGTGRLAGWIGGFLATFAVDPEAVMIDGCLALDGKRIIDVDRKRLDDWESVICERHRAVIWLEGSYPLYTELPVDT
jgi:hypothetical protein